MVTDQDICAQILRGVTASLAAPPLKSMGDIGACPVVGEEANEIGCDVDMTPIGNDANSIRLMLVEPVAAYIAFQIRDCEEGGNTLGFYRLLLPDEDPDAQVILRDEESGVSLRLERTNNLMRIWTRVRVIHATKAAE